MNYGDSRVVYFKTDKTGCSSLHGESWTEAELAPSYDGHNAIFHRARQATLDKLHERFPTYRPPSTDRRSFGSAVEA